MFEVLDNLLSEDYNIDYWSDDVVVRATDIVKKFSSYDWETLNNNWKHKPVYWQRQLAHTIFPINHPYVFDILISMLNLDMTVALESIDSLFAREDNLRIRPAVKEDLINLYQIAPDSHKDLIENLIERITNDNG